MQTSRPSGLAIITTLGGVFAFANAKSFSDFQNFFGSGPTFLLYGAINIIGAVYIAIVVPEI